MKKDNNCNSGIGDADDDEMFRQLISDIEQHFSENPYAADTVEGIAEWWLARQRYEHAVDRVENALSYLVKTGKVKKSETSNGTSVYSLMVEKYE